MKIDKGSVTSDVGLILFCILLSLVILAIDSFLPLGIAGGVPYVLVVLVSLWSPRKQLPIYMAIATSILTLVGVYASPDGGEFWSVFTNRFLALFAIWTITVLSVQRKAIYEEKEKAVEKIKVLSGLLSICASCKKIRDDKGHWRQIESYIGEHSEAQFSHGICPDCAKKLYPDIDLFKGGKNDD
jgi:hypothetical protein